MNSDSLNQIGQATRLFFSYSHRDEEMRDELAVHLKLLKRQQWIAEWHDRRIAPEEEWKGEIDHNLACADIILLLVSEYFIDSDYCWDVDLKLRYVATRCMRRW